MTTIAERKRPKKIGKDKYGNTIYLINNKRFVIPPPPPPKRIINEDVKIVIKILGSS